DLETTGEPGRATGRGDREEADVGDMTRGHREGGGEGFGSSTSRGNREDLESSGGGITRGDEGSQGRPGDEGYREGYREGLREGLREAGVLGETGGRGDVDDRGRVEEESYRGGEGRGEAGGRGDLGASGATGRLESTEEGMSRRGAGESSVGDEGMTGGGREDRERSERREDTGEQEESSLTRVWRRVRR
ncbi:MAG: hypothetical protein M3N45_09380, partial [Actinomycetota bacterium]|nr:hypothetical protein [Actinomycetota bacterium]